MLQFIGNIFFSFLFLHQAVFVTVVKHLIEYRFVWPIKHGHRSSLRWVSLHVVEYIETFPQREAHVCDISADI